MAHRRKTARSAILFFEVLPFKQQKTTRRFLGVSRPLEISDITTIAIALFPLHDLMGSSKITSQESFTLKKLIHLNAQCRFLSVNGKTSKKSMAHRGETAQSAMLFFEVLPFTDKKNKQKKNDAAALVVSRLLGDTNGER